MTTTPLRLALTAVLARTEGSHRGSERRPLRALPCGRHLRKRLLDRLSSLSNLPSPLFSLEELAVCAWVASVLP